MYKFAVLTSLLLASTALAAPKSRIASRLARRAAQGRQSLPAKRISNTEYSENWAGAVYASGDGTYTAVTGTFTVPTPTTEGAAAAWVGIDGDTCDTAILQTGVDFTYSDGEVSYDAWYEWYPDYAYDFSGITISAGDVIRATVTATSTTSGTAVIENTTTGQTVTEDLTSTYALCEENAEWIVEDFEENGALVELTDFGTVTFTDAYATTSSGEVTPSGATAIDIEQNGEVYTSVTIGDDVTVQYT
ncbi:hypothetical protein CONPUDRAFT_51478 [Coniophora puteana RWD-64-598 SS2]|uniref:Aspergillopepsin n=1 Tax=Coniophora puteana (strain RWD-64-598) TaxID=741705 RepID=A0A5M3MZJ7_CONPW|nr:uncharacterized protein CONPUDRAFT_51478 [Coniophora puteana RWD-64-598 SS2]EIW84065.1 hypothetical protein CONPUDRAFT_51478 [Coniophora puteana RWD-64-598 SS2]